jgi:hypothetical protein
MEGGSAMQLRIWANGRLCSLGKHCWHCVGDDKLADYLTRHHWPARKNPEREFEVLVATVEGLAADRYLKHFAIREMHPTLEFVTSKQQAVLRKLHRQYRDRGGHMWPCHTWIEHDTKYDTEDERWLKAESVFDSDSGGLEE